MSKQIERSGLCPKCRKITTLPAHRNTCQPCYNEYHRMWRLEKLAKESEKLAPTTKEKP